MAARIGLNGFGRMGWLALRAAWGWPELEFAHVNEVKGGVEAAAHLLLFDSIHGRWPHEVRADGELLRIDGHALSFSAHARPGDIPWRDLRVEIVLECSGKFTTAEALAAHLEAGVRKVVVSAPIKAGVPNVVGGVNDGAYRSGGAPHRQRRLLHHQLPGPVGQGDPRGPGGAPWRYHHRARRDQHADGGGRASQGPEARPLCAAFHDPHDHRLGHGH